MPNTISVRVATPRAVGRALPAVLVGESGAVRRARASIDAAGPGSVLILADDGLEPASVARYLHGRSRAGQPFVEIDCAQGSAEDIEAVLLGNRPRAGSGDLETVGAASAVLAARRGTLFIDHLGDLPAIAQRRLARILRDGEVRTTGRDRVRMAARIVAAAPPSLVSDARDGRFRADLLRRFGGQPITLPPLSIRPEDVPAIVPHIAAELAASANRVPPSFTQPALTVLSALQWPGNVSDLRSALERVLKDLPATDRSSGGRAADDDGGGDCGGPDDAAHQPSRSTTAIRARVHRHRARTASVADERCRPHAWHRAREPLSQGPSARDLARGDENGADAMSTPPTRAAAIVIFAALCGTPAAAQPPASVNPSDSAAIRLGPVGINPSLAFRDIGVDNNVFHDADDPKSDFTFTVTPRAEVLFSPRRLRLSAVTAVDYVYFQTYDTERGTNQASELKANVDLGRLQPYVSIGGTNTRERYNSEIDTRARHHDHIYAGGVGLKVASRTTLSAGVRRTTTNFDDTAEFRGEDLAVVLDNTLDGVDGTFGMQLTPLTSVSLVVSQEWQRFDLSPDRDSDTFRITPTVSFSPGGLLTGNAAVGYRRFDGKSVTAARLQRARGGRQRQRDHRRTPSSRHVVRAGSSLLLRGRHALLSVHRRNRRP